MQDNQEAKTPTIDALRRENEDLRALAARNADQARRFARLRGLTARLAASLDRTDLFDEIVRAARDVCNADGTALLLFDETATVLYVEAGQGLDRSIIDRHVPVAASTLETRATIALPDTGNEPDTLVPDLFGATRPGALIVAPIRVEGKPFGVVAVYYGEPHPIPREDVEILNALSDAAAIALRNATAYARILEQGAELARRNDELARQKEELTRLNDELRRASVLKSQFLSTMSHELRTPLTSIIGFGSILLRGRKDESLNDRQRDNTQRILSAARHLVTLINDILDLSRIEAGRLDVFRREVDLHDLLEGLRGELAPQAQAKGIALDVEIGPDLDRVVTDGNRLRQILTNLLSNAIKFTFEGGVTLRATHGDEAILVAVADTGMGIQPDQQEHIFDEFYQADQSNTRTAGGTGLGLAISQRLASLLDGHITLHSVPGEGSTFTVVLPPTLRAHAVSSHGGSVLATSHAARQTSAGTGVDATRVLVIDDDPEMALLLERALEGSSYAVTAALSTDEGLRKAREVLPDAILLDVMMPETDGWRALHRLKSDPRVAHIPVVMHTIVADQALGFSLGATDYLVKPVERDTLLATLNRLEPISNGPVLIVDDDEDMRTLLARMLGEENIPIVLAPSGEEALHIVEQQAPRLILLDLMMPGLDGFAVLHRLRADTRTAHTPVVILTAKTLTAEEERVLSREASMIVTKNGVPLERLLTEVRAVLEVTP